MDGAKIGTARNTISVSDITRAIWRPAYLSRTMDTTSTRLAAAPMPCSTRAINNISKEVAAAAMRLNTT